MYVAGGLDPTLVPVRTAASAVMLARQGDWVLALRLAL